MNGWMKDGFLKVFVPLQLEQGKLWFQQSCNRGSGEPPDLLGPAGRRINDGNWHTVALELNRNFSSLALDNSYVEQRHAPLSIRTFSPDRTIYFGALVSPAFSHVMLVIFVHAFVLFFT